MTRSIRMLGLVATLAVVPAMAGAQRSTSVGISAGASVPMGDLADAADMGYNVAGHLYLLPGAKVHLRADVGFDSWKFKGGGDASIRSISGMLNLYAHAGAQGATMRPYILGGGGISQVKSTATVLGTTASSSSTKPGIQVGGGLEFQLSGFTTHIEAKYVSIFTEGSSSSWVPITFGIHF